jgi:hypothetical protein
VVRRIFAYKRREIKGGWKKFYRVIKGFIT